MSRTPLPVDVALPELIGVLQTHNAAVLQAPTGAGKTTRVPPALIEAGLGPIVMLEPRRLAARAAAQRMAVEHGSAIGDLYGYQVRFENKVGPNTRVRVVTPGVLLRMLQDDPFLEAISVLIFDEFHERGLESDLALGMARLIQQTVRPNLRVVVMSATLAAEPIAAYLGGCPIVRCEGRLFPVDIQYQARPNEQPWPTAAANATRRLLDQTTGDVLVFLPGLHEIRKTTQELESLTRERDVVILPLYGDLPLEQQDAALRPLSSRKIVLATNVAETSVTVEGVTGVVDTGLARQLSFDPAVGLDRLILGPISRASAEQRAGRAGRTQPGVCVRLWRDVEHRSRPEQTDPEIRRLDLAGALLQLLAFGEKDPASFPWLDAPTEAAVAQGLNLLRMLGALDDGRLTELGRRMSRLPVHPRLARLLLEAQKYGCAEHAALAAALLSERDPFQRGPRALKAMTPTDSDIADRVELLEVFERTGRIETDRGEIHRGGAGFILRARDQLLRLLDRSTATPSPEGMGRALLAAFPDRLARRRNHGGNRGVMVGGRGVKLLPSSRVNEPELFLAIDVDAGSTEAEVRMASGVRREWLPSERLREETRVEFNPHTEKIEAKRVRLFEDLQLEVTPVLLPEAETTAAVLAQAAFEKIDRVRPAADTPVGQFLLRLTCLREWLPELGLPDLAGEGLRELLTDLSTRCRSFVDLRNADWLGTIQGRLTYAQRQAIDREAPERLEVPSGSQIAVTYEVGRPPVLAVRIQEMFGLAETPRIAGGRVRVLLHLLAPNYRPQQVTEDLASFWANTYPTVRKELRARYPKHSWPEDPLDAEAMRGPKRRK